MKTAQDYITEHNEDVGKALQAFLMDSAGKLTARAHELTDADTAIFFGHHGNDGIGWTLEMAASKLALARDIVSATISASHALHHGWLDLAIERFEKVVKLYQECA
jgi:hypothetical protein